MILVDSSAWVEFLRATGSSVNQRMRDALEGDLELATTDVILMEILAGARDEEDRDRLRRLLYGLTFLPVEGRRTTSRRPRSIVSAVAGKRRRAS